jgi:hypothetical protein
MKDAIKNLLQEEAEDGNSEAKMLVELNVAQDPRMSAPPPLMGSQNEAHQEK